MIPLDHVLAIPITAHRPHIGEVRHNLVDSDANYSFEMKQTAPNKAVYRVRCEAQVDTSTDMPPSGRLRLRLAEYSAECIEGRKYHKMWAELVSNMVQGWLPIIISKFKDMGLLQAFHKNGQATCREEGG